MKPVQRKGQLIAWKDNKGFGFIKPNDSGKDVFLHISALKKDDRHPQVGDTIVYAQVTQPGGKIRAAKPSIQGVTLPSSPTPKKIDKQGLFKLILSVVIISIIALVRMEVTRSTRKPGCVIKGNISYATGEKIYHLPGMEDYESTVIDPTRGERWFCTEAEAKANGWRKAPR